MRKLFALSFMLLLFSSNANCVVLSRLPDADDDSGGSYYTPPSTTVPPVGSYDAQIMQLKLELLALNDQVLTLTDAGEITYYESRITSIEERIARLATMPTMPPEQRTLLNFLTDILKTLQDTILNMIRGLM